MCVRARVSDISVRFGVHVVETVCHVSLNIESWFQERISDLQRFERMYERARERVEESQRQCEEVASKPAVCVSARVLLLLELL